jgi:FtsP/CotA-like multicopper oxidase with cupredoxin domain
MTTKQARRGNRKIAMGIASIAFGCMGGIACDAPPGDEEVTQTSSAVTEADPAATTTTTATTTTGTAGTGGSTALAPILDPTTIPRFKNQLPMFSTYKPILTRDSKGNVIRKEFTVHIAKFTQQQLPSGFPATPLFGYGGDVIRPDGSVGFERTSPGPKFEQTRNVPALIHYRNELQGRHPLPVDPTLDWANPNNFPKPRPPFLPFPPGYDQAQSPITHTTHTHGIEVVPEFDGTPDTWFTANGIRGPEYVSNNYLQPVSNESATFWYHDHAFGVTRLDVGMGLSGFSIVRDPNLALDRLGGSQILAFEDVYDWAASAGFTAGQDTRHTQGAFSVSLKAKGSVTLKSRPFEITSVGSSVSLDFFLPQEQPSTNFGSVKMFAECPSRNFPKTLLGTVSLNGKTKNAFNKLTFPVPSSVANSCSTCEDLTVTLGLDVPTNATGTYLVDNITGGVTTPARSPLPQGQFDVPIIVQDRSFRTDGTVFYPTVGRNPDVNPYWELTVDGNTNLVNGKVWPNMNVKRHAYRFRMLNSANQRFYRMRLSNGAPFTVIGSDGGYLRAPRTVTEFQIGVTERVDFIVDFSRFAPGTKIVLQNLERHFPPIGDPVDPNTDGTVMQFTVDSGAAVSPLTLPTTLNNIPTLATNRPTRTLIQNVESDDQGRILQAELDGQLFHEETTELPTVGSTEDWQFVNTTPLTHNKHVHLIQFQLIDRRNIDAPRYLADWIKVNGNPPFDHPTLKLPVEPYITGAAEAPNAEESGWKDTIRTPAGQVTRIRVRWAPTPLAAVATTPGVNLFPFDPTFGIGYIWHCHLLEHEDNEMMRPMTIIPTWKAGTRYPVGTRRSPGVNAGLVDFNGVDYQARVANSSTQPPNQRPDLWERVNNQNGDWAVQIIYRVGDRVFFNGHVYRALRQNQATNANRPDVAPTFWTLVL